MCVSEAISEHIARAGRQSFFLWRINGKSLMVVRQVALFFFSVDGVDDLEGVVFL